MNLVSQILPVLCTLVPSLYAASLSGTVYIRDDQSSQPASGVRVTVQRTDGGEILGYAHTDHQGRYNFPDLPLTTLVVSVRSPGYVARASRISVNLAIAAPPAPLDFELIPGGVVTGRITDLQGEPLQNAQIELHLEGASERATAVSDDRGEYRVFGLIAGRYRMLARVSQDSAAISYYPDRSDAGGAQPIDVAPGSEVRGIDVRFPSREPSPAAKVASRGSIRGTVTSLQTGLPLRGASVQLVSMAKGRVSMQTVATGAGGEYFIAALDAGTYTISAEKAGYIAASFGRPIVLTEKQDRTGVDLTLSVAPVISGRVTDGDGHPAIGMDVIAYRWRFRNGQRIAAKAAATTTDDRGRYRLTGLTPGRYFVGASRSMPTIGYPTGELDFEGGKTFYPSTTSASQAVVLDLHDGQEFPQANLALQSQATFSISGVVSDARTAGPCTACTVRAVSVEESMSLSQVSAAVDSSGAYRIRGVPPGRYRIVAEQSISGRRLRSTQDAVISNRDLTRINLVAGLSVTVRGRVVYESAPAENARSGLTVQLTTADAFEMNQEIRPDDSFEVSGLPLDRYTIGTGILPDGAYLKAVRISGQNQPTPEIDLTRPGPPGPIELVVSYKPARLTGQVKAHLASDSAQSPSNAAVNAIVVLFSSGTQLLPEVHVSTSPDGTFRLNAAPGAYTAFAVSRDSKLDWEDPDLRNQYRSFGRKIVLDTENPATLELPLAPDDGSLF